MINECSLPLYLTLFIYALVIFIILYKKPKILFDNQGNIKCTGFGCNKTLLSFPIFIVLFSIITYFVIIYLYNNYF